MLLSRCLSLSGENELAGPIRSLLSDGLIAAGEKSSFSISEKGLQVLHEQPDSRERVANYLAIWHNRAFKEFFTGDREAAKLYLGFKWYYQSRLAEIDGTDPPPLPEDNDWPFDPSRVPRKPHPYAGAGEVALPLPEPSREE